ncbi:trehalose-phosphatase [Sphingomonas mesophila]|uniref:trehalose-phosphatase n=1 Tax=Sphingomonas mesophila TaxID=2303576 RepID=UPI000E571CCD|nr:trehalose-phosphatase [Sphingomonas mesophila]
MTLPFPPPELLYEASLFLDLDGTLVEFADTPEAIDVCDRLRGLLKALDERLDGRIAVVSGRALADLARRLDLPTLPMAGSHGAERRTADGRTDSSAASEAVLAATLEANEFALEQALTVEAKPFGVALHFRQRPELEPAVDSFAAQVAERHGLAVQKGSMVRELRLPGRTKGDVVRLFMDEPPFDRGRPLMLGDDITDEDAFAAVNALGGASVLVGPERPTAARYRLPDVTAVREWLAA